MERWWLVRWAKWVLACLHWMNCIPCFH
jgi:hypothetical protein